MKKKGMLCDGFMSRGLHVDATSMSVLGTQRAAQLPRWEWPLAGGQSNHSCAGRMEPQSGGHVTNLDGQGTGAVMMRRMNYERKPAVPEPALGSSRPPRCSSFFSNPWIFLLRLETGPTPPQGATWEVQGLYGLSPSPRQSVWCIHIAFLLEDYDARSAHA